MPTASISTLKRRCLAPHSGHKNSQHCSNETKIKFGKVPDTGTSIPSINLQYCKAFAKMEQRKPFRFDERFSYLREYSTINRTDAKAPVILGSKTSFDVGRTWLSYVNEDDRWNPLHEEDESDMEGCKRERSADGKVVPLQALPCHDYHSVEMLLYQTLTFSLKKILLEMLRVDARLCVGQVLNLLLQFLQNLNIPVVHSTILTSATSFANMVTKSYR